MAEAESVAVIQGPKGEARILEIWSDGRLMEYQVEVDGEKTTCANLGDAYIVAGEKVGKPT